MVRAILIDAKIAKNKVKKSKDFGGFWLGKIGRNSAFYDLTKPEPSI